MPKAHQRGSQNNHILNGESIFHPSPPYDALSQGPLRAWGVLGSARKLSWPRACVSLALTKSYIIDSLDLGISISHSHFMTLRAFFPQIGCHHYTLKMVCWSLTPSSDSFKLSPIDGFPRLLTEREAPISL